MRFLLKSETTRGKTVFRRVRKKGSSGKFPKKIGWFSINGRRFMAHRFPFKGFLEQGFHSLFLERFKENFWLEIFGGGVVGTWFGKLGKEVGIWGRRGGRRRGATRFPLKEGFFGWNRGIPINLL